MVELEQGFNERRQQKDIISNYYLIENTSIINVRLIQFKLSFVFSND